MVRKIIYLIFIYLLITNILCCSQDTTKKVFKVDKNTLIINDNINIDLHNPIDKVLNALGNDYEEKLIPDHIGYYLLNYPVRIYVEDSINKIVSLRFKFYDNKKENSEKLIDEISISDIKITKETNFEEMKKILKNKNVKYKIEEDETIYKFKLENNQILVIIYIKSDLTIPYEMEIKIK